MEYMEAAPRTGAQVKARQVQAAQRDCGFAQFAHRARHGLRVQRAPFCLHEQRGAFAARRAPAIVPQLHRQRLDRHGEDQSNRLLAKR